MLIVLASCVVLNAKDVHASSNAWSAGSFVLGQREQTLADNDCHQKSVRIGGVSSTTTANLCIYERPNWRYAYYQERSGPSYAPRYQTHLVVGIESDAAMYRVNNIQTADRAIVMPESNHFLYSTLTAGFTNNRALYAVKNLPSRLVRSSVGVETVYNLQTNATDLVITDSAGNKVTNGSLGVSLSGSYIGVEIQSVGLARIDTKTFEISLFSNYKHRYGFGSDAHITFIVSDDGTYIATFDYNIEPKIYTVSSDCTLDTVYISDTFTQQAASMTSCTTDDGRMRSALEQRFSSSEIRSMRGDRFREDGKVLYFKEYEFSDDLEATEYDVPLYSKTYQQVNPLEYLALGDSFSSGEGDTEKDGAGKKYYRAYTDNGENKSIGQPREKCHLSTRSYPYKIASAMSLSLGTEWQSVACSGATMWDMKMQGSTDYGGQNNRLEGFDVGVYSARALNDFIPGRVKQLEFVKKYKPELITLMVGGNDVDFGGKLRTCIGIGTCYWAQEEGKEALGDEIRSKYEDLKKFYTELKDSSTVTATIYAVSYPKFISPDPGADCSDSNIGFLNDDERKMIHEATVYLNEIIRRASNDSGIRYVDIADSFDSHLLCGKGEKYVTGIAFLGDNELQESFHPNAKGHFKMSEDIFSKLNIEGSESECTDVNCQSTPEYSDFLGGTDLIVEGVEATKDPFIKGLLNKLTVGLFRFKPNSQVSVTIYSDRMDLGNYYTDIDGALNASILTTQDIEPGYHTLVLKGLSYSGEPIVYFQEVLVQSADADDRDGDGIVDSIDKCMYFSPSGKYSSIDDMCELEDTQNEPNAASTTLSGLKVDDSYILGQSAVKDLKNKLGYVSNRQNNGGVINRELDGAISNKNGHTERMSDNKLKIVALGVIFIASIIVIIHRRK